MKQGYIHLYTGDGKGKTTVAFGLALRALCSGRSVYIGQFVKSMKYNETKIDEYFDQVKIEQFGQGCFINTTPDKKDVEMAQQGLQYCANLLSSGRYDMVILDELTIAMHFNLISINHVLEVLKRRNSIVEVVITGRYAPPELIEFADIVTEMCEVKHYYQQGILSRNGIDK